jgi:hypothetical protein
MSRTLALILNPEGVEHVADARANDALDLFGLGVQSYLTLSTEPARCTA